MRLKDLHFVYFLGIGGIGMSALARWFKFHGHFVAGYDKTPTALTQKLEAEGISIHYVDAEENIPGEIKTASKDNVLVVYTPAVPKGSIELNYFQAQGYTIMKRSRVLGEITAENFTIAVAGTHGKTTTSSMIAHLLKSSGKNILAFLGGITQNYNSNLLINENSGQETILVAEADEYDRSFLALHPNMAVITSADADHLDIYGDKNALHQSMRDFIGRVNKSGLLVINENIYEHLVDGSSSLEIVRYSLNKGAARAENIRVENATFVFDFAMGERTLKDIHLLLPGFHNVENAVAAIVIALKLGVEEENIKKALATFKGVKRRFEYILKTENIVFIDDYAHHPAEIEAFLTSVKALYPGKKVTAIFQPHLYSRTRDFADGFSESLSIADEVILLEIYPARELPIEGVSSQMLFPAITSPSKTVTTKDNLLDVLEERDLEVVATIGAGDIDKLVKPVKELLERRYHGN